MTGSIERKYGLVPLTGLSGNKVMELGDRVVSEGKLNRVTSHGSGEAVEGDPSEGTRVVTMASITAATVVTMAELLGCVVSGTIAGTVVWTTGLSVMGTEWVVVVATTSGSTTAGVVSS